MKINKTMGIYIHIPFCVKKCNYCDFLSFPVDEMIKPSYIDALVKEIKAYGMLFGKSGSRYEADIKTIFFGGGTPSILESKYIDKILSALYDNFNINPDVEITIECNPGTLTLPKLSDYKYFGINRLSIGLQSTSACELKSLGRIHSYESFKESFMDARSLGFDNINIDVMSALPGQTVSSYKDTLNKVLSFEPEHISAYSLIIEEGTPFFDIYDEYNEKCGYPPLPSEEDEREMYYLTEELLRKHGYKRYEISNYSKPGYECKHNLSYWKRTNYIGLGLGASSFVDGVRFKNIENLNDYINTDFSNHNFSVDREFLTLNDAMSEFMFLGLRVIEGIKISDFKKQFEKDLFDVFGNEIEQLFSQKLLLQKDDYIMLTKKGIDVSNYVFSEFIL